MTYPYQVMAAGLALALAVFMVSRRLLQGWELRASASRLVPFLSVVLSFDSLRHRWEPHDIESLLS